jgi:hypothetical protein
MWVFNEQEVLIPKEAFIFACGSGGCGNSSTYERVYNGCGNHVYREIEKTGCGH